MKKNFLQNYFHLLKYDLSEESFYSHAIDQKLLPDVISFIAETILKFSYGNLSKKFSIKEINKFTFFKEEFLNRFSKSPAPKEIDKFVGQPLDLLFVTGVLKRSKVGGKKIYSINSLKMVEFLKSSDTNSLNFLIFHFLKLVNHMSIGDEIIKYVSNTSSNTQDLKKLKSSFKKFFFANTKISKDYEPPRKANKMINVLAYYYKSKGSKSGVSKQIYLSDLQYNRPNFRDKYKDKSISRADYNKLIKLETGHKSYKNWIQRAKNEVKENKYSEVYQFKNKIEKNKNNYYKNKISSIFSKMEQRDKFGVHAHHIFPEHEYPDLASNKENIIYLNAQEHLQYIHTMGDTRVIDKEFQKILILAKLETIKDDVKNSIQTYDLRDFIFTLNRGLETEFRENESFETIEKHLIERFFN